MSGREIHGLKMPPQFKPPDINPRKLAMILLGLVVVLAVLSSVFQVEPEEVGVVMTFGKYSHEA